MQNKVTYWIKEIKCTKEPDLKNYKLIEEFTKYDETKITKEWDDPKPYKTE